MVQVFITIFITSLIQLQYMYLNSIINISTNNQIEYKPTGLSKFLVYNCDHFNSPLISSTPILQYCIRIYIGNSTLLEYSIALLTNLKLLINKIVVYVGVTPPEVKQMCYAPRYKT